MREVMLTVETLPIEDLIPSATNAKLHPEHQIAQIAASIVEFGFNDPIAIGEGNVIIEGHGRLLAAKRLKLTEVPVIRLNHLTEAQRKAYTIAHNQLTLNTGFDLDLLTAELQRLNELEFDLELTGFDADELTRMLNPKQSGGGNEDKLPKPLPNPVTRTGDVWILGKHRLVCGDATDAQVVEKSLNGTKPPLMVTDPPYGVQYDPHWRAEATPTRSKSEKTPIQNDDVNDWTKALKHFKGAIVYVWHASLFMHKTIELLEALKLIPRAEIIWVKPNFVYSRGRYHWGHESAIYAVRSGKTSNWKGDNKQVTVWHASPDQRELDHPNQKPVEIMRRPVLHHTSQDDSVYDPFVGSGTTIIACELTKRACHAVEIDPVHVDTAVRRWEELTEGEAILESTGETFVSVKAERLGENN